MANVRTTFTSDDKDVQKALERMNRQTAKLTAENRKLRSQTKAVGRASKRTGDTQNRALTSGIANVAKLTAGYLSLQKILGAVNRELTALVQRQKAFAGEGEAFSKEFIQEVGLTGDLAKAREVQTAIEALPDATRRQGLKAFAGFSAGAPKLALQKRLRATREVARLAPIKSAEQLEQVGLIAAQIGQISPEKNVEEQVEVAEFIRGRAGRNVTSLARRGSLRALASLKQVGLSSDEATALMLEALEANIRPSSFDTLVGRLTEKMDVAKPARGEALSPEDRARNRFAALAPRERLNALFADRNLAREILGSTVGTQFSLIKQRDVTQTAREIARIQRGDFLGDILEAAGKSRAGQEVALVQRGRRRRDVFVRKNALQELINREAFQEAQQVADEQGIGATLKLAAFRFINEQHRKTGDPDARLGGLGGLKAVDPEAHKKFLRDNEEAIGTIQRDRIIEELQKFERNQAARAARAQGE